MVEIFFLAMVNGFGEGYSFMGLIYVFIYLCDGKCPLYINTCISPILFCEQILVKDGDNSDWQLFEGSVTVVEWVSGYHTRLCTR